ncbi:MAG: type II toxin-antitoxin system HicB family antitoxin [Lautropia sp.]|nr:type II toxin-antitoxin system HicB family antitoxin [Lautropia sp.]
MAQYAVVIEKRGSSFRAYVPEKPECTATGSSLAEAEQSLRAMVNLLTQQGARTPDINAAARSGGYVWVSPAT